MRHALKYLAAGAVTALLSLAGMPAQAQAPCPIQNMSPRVVTSSTYTVVGPDTCAVIIFTSGATVRLPTPGASVGSAGMPITMIPAGPGGITLVPDQPTDIYVNGVSQNAANIPAGSSGTMVVSDGTNWFAIYGTPGALNLPANLSPSNVYPGTFLGNSPITPLPNGVLQITNPASIIPADRGDIMRPCAGVSAPVGSQRNRSPAWLYVLDYLQRPYKVPLC